MRIHEITFSNESVVLKAGTAENQLVDHSVWKSGLETAFLIFSVISDNNERINHISPEFIRFNLEPTSNTSAGFIQDLPIINTRQPRVEYTRLEEGGFLGVRHLFVALFSKSFFDQVQPNEMFTHKLFSRMFFDIEQYQIKTLIMDQLAIPDIKENFAWNRVLRDCEMWKNSLQNNLHPPLDDCLIVCPKDNVWDHYSNETKTTSTIMSYNVLAQSYTSTHYAYCKQYIPEHVRSPKIVKMVDSIHADIQMFQEMEKTMLTKLIKPHHHAVFQAKEGRKEGLAILIDKQVWDVTQEGRRKLEPNYPQEMIFVACRHKATQKTLLVVCTHLIGDPNLLEIQKEQAEVLANWSKMVGLQSDCQNIIIGGDFNADQESQAYKVVEQSGFKSALKEIHGKEPTITFNTDRIHRSIDYLWLNLQTIKPCTKRFDQQQIQLKHEEALPNHHHGSDHIPIYTKLSLL